MLNQEPFYPEAEVDVDRLITRIAELEQDSGITVRRLGRIDGEMDILQAEMFNSSPRVGVSALSNGTSVPRGTF